MMYPRLVLLKQFLAEDGAIFVSLDDNEISHLRLIMDEIFGINSFLANAIWQKKYSKQNDSKALSVSHDYTLIYCKTPNMFVPGKIPRNEKQNKAFKNPDDDPRGLWQSVAYTCAKTAQERPNLYYSILNPFTGKEVWPDKSRVWAYDKSRTKKNIENGLLWWGKNGEQSKPRMKSFLSKVSSGIVPDTLWFRDDVGDNQDSAREIISFFGENNFATPKPTRLIQRILQIASDGPSLILDSFAGSGTTGHAVLKQNAADGGNRKFILVEMEPNIAKDITAERVRRVIEGYTDSKGKTVPGLGGGFQYCRLSAEPLFNAFGAIRDDVSFEQLAEFVWFVETGTGYDNSRPKSPLLGIHEGRAIYLLYNGILKDRKINGGNVLTGPVLSTLPAHEGAKVIYAAANKLGAPRCQRDNITFKQTPYALDV
jgi:site-specific DNA-methyltransferase (adenine-specific)/adenine-specific DNA-methyltransferase